MHHYGLDKDAQALRDKNALYLRLGQAKVAATPDDPKAHAELGNQYVDLGDYSMAAQCYRDALRLAPKSAELLKDLGGVLHLMGRTIEAEKALRLATTVDANHVEAWRNLGVVLAAREEWRQARECFSTAIALAPENAELRRYFDIAQSNVGGAASA